MRDRRALDCSTTMDEKVLLPRSMAHNNTAVDAIEQTFRY
jgi:hypothetical protein